MPFKNLDKKREYQRELMKKRRANQNVRPSPVSPMLDPNPKINLLDPEKIVSPKSKLLDPVRPKQEVRPKIDNVRPEKNIFVKPSNELNLVKPSEAVRPKPTNDQEYNQAFEKLKSQWATQEKGKCYGYRPEPITKLHYCNACDYHHHRNETKPWLKVQKPQPQKIIKPNSQLWSDYYSCKKPFCLNCQQLGIKETEYKFCSEYECQVKHWTIFNSFNN